MTTFKPVTYIYALSIILSLSLYVQHINASSWFGGDDAEATTPTTPRTTKSPASQTSSGVTVYAAYCTVICSALIASIVCRY